jgi:hypothetical protein
MAGKTQYDYNPSSPVNVSREVYSNVGSSDNFVGTYPYDFKGSTFEIWDAPSGGNQLVLNTDYELRNKNEYLSDRSGYDVYTGYRITTAGYQTGNIYITYDIVRSENAAAIPNDLRTRIDNLEANPAASRGYLSGYEISNGSDADHEIDIEAGVARNDDNDGDISLASQITIDIEDSGLGGLDTGSVAADTFYYLWAIYNPTSDLTNGIFSLSSTSPTLPAGYTKKRRIRGAVLTDGSSNILGFSKKDNNFIFNTQIQDVADGAVSDARNAASVSVPPGFIGIFMYNHQDTSGFIWIGSTDEVDVQPSQTGVFTGECAGSSYRSGSRLEIIVDGSSQIGYRATGAPLLWINTIGFCDMAEV